MKSKVVGRKVWSLDEMELLCESDGASNSFRAKRADPGVVADFMVAKARRFVKALRHANVKGDVVFQGDPKHYPFTPEAGFVYHASIH